MREIFSLLAVPISGTITYILGYLSHKRTLNAKLKAIELENYQKVVDFYKGTFDDLKQEIQQLHKELLQAKEERDKLTKELSHAREEVSKLNERLSFLVQQHP